MSEERDGRDVETTRVHTDAGGSSAEPVRADTRDVVDPAWGYPNWGRIATRAALGLMGLGVTVSMIENGPTIGRVVLALILLPVILQAFFGSPVDRSEGFDTLRRFGTLTPEEGVGLLDEAGEPLSRTEALVRIAAARDIVDEHLRPSILLTVALVMVTSGTGLIALLNPRVLDALGIPVGLPLLVVGMPLVAALIGIPKSRRHADALDAALDRQQAEVEAWPADVPPRLPADGDASA